jgi:thiol-disulfide isomerase/thioredoxin
MASIIDILYEKYIQPNQTFILAIFMLIIFITAGYYAYNWFVQPVIENQTTQDMANYNGRKSEATVFIFTADWCPHCKRAKPEWDKFAASYNDKEVGDYIIKTQLVDCTDGDSPLIQQYGIDGYPTVLLIKDENQRVDYDAKINESSLSEFIKSVLQ